MRRELNVVEQRYQAVLEVLGDIPVTEVAERFGVTRQTVHPLGGPLPRERAAGRSHAPKARPGQLSADPGSDSGPGKAVELDRLVPSSGNPRIAGQHVWPGPAMTGRTVRLWAGLKQVQVLLAARTTSRETRRHKASNYG
jgi:hypothetical protein